MIPAALSKSRNIPINSHPPSGPPFPPVKKSSLIILALLLSLTAHAKPLIEAPEIEATTLRPEWLDEELTLDEVTVRTHRGQATSVLSLTKMQLDEQNRWFIDGKEGKGPMPMEAYRRMIMTYLQDDENLTTMQRLFQRGDRIFHYRTPTRDEGYLLVRDKRVIFNWLLFVG